MERESKLAAKAGFTLIEMLVVLVLIALAAGLAFGAADKALDSSITHTEVYNFQRQLLDLRERSYREDRVFELRDSNDPDAAAAAQQVADRAAGVVTDNDGDGVEDPLPSPFPVSFDMRDRYTYMLSAPITVTPDGTCSNVVVTVQRDGVAASVVQGLSDADGCHLVRTG